MPLSISRGRELVAAIALAAGLAAAVFAMAIPAIVTGSTATAGNPASNVDPLPVHSPTPGVPRAPTASAVN